MKIKSLQSYYEKKLFKSINLKYISKKIITSLIEKMYTIRFSEEILAKNKKDGVIKGPVHLAIGQEAIPSAVSLCIKKKDRLFGNHRSHGHIISLGTNLKLFFSEILGKKIGLSGGMGGSMHLIDKSVSFYGSTPIVGGTVPIATGSALSSKLDKNKDVTISYLGDSALEEGAIHECLNLSSLMNLPIIYVVENNFFASHLNISERQPLESTTRFAISNNIKYFLLDGNNPIEVYKKFKLAIDYCRLNSKPIYFEVVTYRWLGHVDWREDVDVGVNRSRKDIEKWKKRDPIKRLIDESIKKKILSGNQIENLKSRIKLKIEKSWQFALRQKNHKPSDLFKNVI